MPEGLIILGSEVQGSRFRVLKLSIVNGASLKFLIVVF
jgi:hypothetical protein